MKQKAKRSFALLLALVMVFSLASVLGACGKYVHECDHVCEECGKCTSDCTNPVCADKCPGHETPAPHECKHVCPECGKCLDETCTDPICADKCEGHAAPAPHVCGHVCPTCGKCTDNTCTDPVCAEKCPGHGETKDFTPLTSPQAGTYYMGMKCGDNAYHYITGNMSGYYMETTTDVASAATVDLIADGEGWLMKCGTNYIEIELSGTHINAVYKAARSAGKHWTWDTANSVFVWTENSKLYFLGTYGTFTTVGGGDYATHISDNYKAVLGTFGSGPIEKPDPESVTLNKTGKVYLAPQAGNYIQLNATVEPSAAAQDIVWASSNEQAATVENGKVTYVGAGETVISATAKDTTIKAEVTIVVTDKGSKQQPLSVDEAIALMDTAGDGVTLGDSNNKFYITGKVEEGSVFADSNWMVNLLGTDSKKLQAVFDHSTAYSKLYVNPESGKLDNYTLVLQVSLKKDGGIYTVVEASVDSGTRPAVASIKIDETAGVKMPIHAKLEVKEVLPANAQLDGTEQWHSSDESKATVDNKGEVTGVAAGSVEVWVSFGEIISNKCTVTITQQETSNKIVYDWTTSLTADSVVDEVYTTTPSSKKDHKTDYLDVWTPGQTEITALKFTKFVVSNKTSNAGGFAFYPVTAAGTADITTAHKIKKITFKIVAFTYADTIKLSVNDQQVVHEKNGATYNGKLDSAFEVTVELPEATDTIQIGAALELNNAFAIVGMTFETETAASTSFAFDWTTSLTADSVVDEVYTTTPSSKKDHKTDYLDVWTPGQTEITALKFTKFVVSNKTSNAGGFAFYPVTAAGTADITTAHKIKKITFKIVAFTYADTIKLSVNDQQVVHEKNGATYNGKLDSAFEVTVELPEATDTIQIGAALELNNAFAIVGMTFEW